jgi:hypothetical protein
MATGFVIIVSKSGWRFHDANALHLNPRFDDILGKGRGPTRDPIEIDDLQPDSMLIFLAERCLLFWVESALRGKSDSKPRT